MRRRVDFGFPICLLRKNHQKFSDFSRRRASAVRSPPVAGPPRRCPRPMGAPARAPQASARLINTTGLTACGAHDRTAATATQVVDEAHAAPTHPTRASPKPPGLHSIDATAHVARHSSVMACRAASPTRASRRRPCSVVRAHARCTPDNFAASHAVSSPGGHRTTQLRRVVTCDPEGAWHHPACFVCVHRCF